MAIFFSGQQNKIELYISSIFYPYRSTSRSHPIFQAMKELQANREAAALGALEAAWKPWKPWNGRAAQVDPRYRRAVDAAVMIVKHERGRDKGLDTKNRNQEMKMMFEYV